MPPKSASQGTKQTSLLGFFTKPTTPASNRSRVPATPATAASESSVTKRTPASTTTDAAEKRRAVIRAAAGSPTGGIKANAESSATGKALANDAAEGKAGVGKKEGGKVDSDVFLGSSPLSAVDVLDDEDTTVVEAKEDKSTDVAKREVKTDDGDADMPGEQEEEEDEQPVRSRVSLVDRLER